MSTNARRGKRPVESARPGFITPGRYPALDEWAIRVWQRHWRELQEAREERGEQ